MALSILHAFLPHLDPDASLAFYRDALGLEVRGDVGAGAVRRLTVGPVGRPCTSLVLEPPAAGPTVTDVERRTVLELMSKGCYARIGLATTDLDGVFARLESSAAEVIQEPIEHPSGVRDCAFLDPAGTLVRITAAACALPARDLPPGRRPCSPAPRDRRSARSHAPGRPGPGT